MLWVQAGCETRDTVYAQDTPSVVAPNMGRLWVPKICPSPILVRDAMGKDDEKQQVRRGLFLIK